MKLSVIALDYDGTISMDGSVDPAVRAAIGAARASGLTVMLVTGRRLDDLRRVAGDLHFVDGVVAENGAELYFPESGYQRALAPPPPPAFLHELNRRGIPFASGTSIVEAEAADAGRLLEVIRATQLPLVLLFNRGRVMVLPQATTKSTGLHEALLVLRLSTHGAVAFGDAENDHDLLQACEVGVAVGWGSPSLQAVADDVVRGNGPPDLAAYIHRLLRDGASHLRTNRRKLLLGYTDEGSPLSIAVRGRNVLVTGDARSGKSWAAGLLCEQLIMQRYCVCVIDPEGDYRPLEGLPGVTLLGGEDPLPRPRDLLRVLRHPDTSVVIDLSHVDHPEKLSYTRTLLHAIAVLRRQSGLPHRILLDEAHLFLRGAEHSELLDLAMDGYTLVTYRASQLPQALLARSEVIVVTCETHPGEIKALHALCRSADPLESWTETLSTLGTGEAAALPITEEAGGTLRRIRLAPRLTPHVRHREKYLDIPIAADRAFVFTSNGNCVNRPRTLRAFVTALECVAPEVVSGHARRRDFSRWLRDVFGDYPLAQNVERLEALDAHEPTGETAAAIGNAIRNRYELMKEE